MAKIWELVPRGKSKTMYDLVNTVNTRNAGCIYPK